MYTANTMPADGLASLGAGASAGLVLIPKGRIFRLHVHDVANSIANESSQMKIIIILTE